MLFLWRSSRNVLQTKKLHLTRYQRGGESITADPLTSLLAQTVPAVSCPSASFPVLFVGGGLRSAGGEGALVDDLHARTALLSAPPPAGSENISVH